MGNDNKPDRHEDHKCEVVQKPDHCHPSHPAPGQHDDHDGHCEGTITGGIVLNCDNHCHQLRTRTFVINEPPQTEAISRAFEQNTFNAWETAGYLVLAHSLLDTGGGREFILTVGWYV